MLGYCAVPNCTGGKSDSQPLFRFPLDKERCKIWLEKCQRQDLIDKPIEHLFRYERLCGKHFQPSALDSEAQGVVLKDDAVPTIFNLPCQSQGNQGKRKEPVKSNVKDTKGRKKMKKPDIEDTKEDTQTASVEDENKEYLKSLFEIALLLGGHNIPPRGLGSNQQDSEKLSNYQALLEYRMDSGDEILKKKWDENKESFPDQLNNYIEVCEQCIRGKLVEEVMQNGHFSLITDELVKISGEWYLPVFLRFVDQSNQQQERFFGLLSFEGDENALAEKLLSEMIEKWGLKMEQCRGQAHSCSGAHLNKIKQFAAKIMERYPAAVLALSSTQTVNVSLAKSMALSGVQLVMSTLRKVESFFGRSPLLRVEIENAISLFYADKEEKANALKGLCKTEWTNSPNVFEVGVELYEALLLWLDSVNDNEDLRWNDQTAFEAMEISKALTDFEFLMALIVLKNTTALTQAFGKNMQGNAVDICCAVNNLPAVLISLKELSDNIDVYHEFWYEEAINLATALDVTVNIPRSFFRKHISVGGVVQLDSYYKEHVSVPLVKHIHQELTELFCETNLKTLNGLSLVPTAVEQKKSTKPDEESVQFFKNDIPNAGTLSAELHCWWVKWTKKGKNESFPSTVQETLQLADIKFFPNMLEVFRLIAIMPSLSLEDNGNVANKRFKTYMENTPDKFKSKSIAFLNNNSDIQCDLDSLVEHYVKLYQN